MPRVLHLSSEMQQALNSGSKVLILDTTLREGEQTPGVSFSVEEKLEIARKLDQVGVDMIEAGHPTVSDDVYTSIKRIASEHLGAEVLAHCRALKSDVDAAVSCGVGRVAIFLGTTDRKLEALGITREQAVEKVVDAVDYAVDHGLKVRFTAEDSTRADFPFLVEICRSAVEAGADRISLPDTVGTMTPEKMKVFFSDFRKKLTVDLDAHCHNDFGMALANSLAAFEGGATGIHATVNGLGERAGIVSLAELAVALRVHFGVDRIHLEDLPELSLLVERYSGVVIPSTAPVVGANAFSHKAGIHVAAVLFDPSTYEAFPPELVGRSREIIIDKYTGRHAVKARLERLGVSLDDDQIEAMVNAIKQRPNVYSYRDEDLIDLAERVSGVDFSAEIPRQIEALMLIKCESNIYTTGIARKIRSIKNVLEVCEISGDFDIEARIMANSINELNHSLERVRAVDGVVGTNTRFVLKKFKTKVNE